ncbi:MAG TPA: TadE/TadG family type IV pilus assembly protein [Candidatus Ozemobacteraceae bacterium]
MQSRSRHGQAIVEMALVLPLFLLLISAIIDFGRVFHVWSSLNYQCIEAAREGTQRRYLLLGRNVFSADTHAAPDAVIRAFFQHQSPLIDVGRYRTPDGKPASAPEIIGVGVPEREVTVRIQYAYPFLTPFIGAMFSNRAGISEFLLSASVTMRKE